MHNIFFLLGSNLGDRLFYLSQARKMIGERLGEIETESQIYESEPWGFEHENMFLNQVIVIKSNFEPERILSLCQKIEIELDRKHYTTGYSARTIDIDILFYDDEIISKSNLIIPHPQLHNRRFTLIALAEIAPEFKHPLLKDSISKLLTKCTDKLDVKIFYI